jgi:hypothetical protein
MLKELMSAIYLSRSGQTFGPYTNEQIEALRSSGELETYQWIFEDPARGWQPVGGPPPSPPQETVASPVAAQTAALNGPGWAAILHDGHHHLVSGEVVQVSAGTCVIGKTLPRSTMPVFRPGASLILNLLDPELNRAENVSVRVEAVTKQGQAWEYQVAWKSVPKLVGEARG